VNSSGTFDAIFKIIRFEGIGGFYKGMGTKILQSVFAAAVLFMVKEELVKAARLLVTKKVPLKYIPTAE
jgi:adenine nucleotide transporter 17